MMSIEFDLMKRIDETKSESERSRLIAELGTIPPQFVPFFARWMRIHDTWRFDGWSDEGYDPSRVDLTRDIQLLSATDYGVSDIYNGGFNQFYGNGTGVFAPEMIEWFERAGMVDAAKLVRQTANYFGEPYVRAQAVRLARLIPPPGMSRREYDPFYELDDLFYECLERENGGFQTNADRWLIENCGIRRLNDPPSAARSQ